MKFPILNEGDLVGIVSPSAGTAGIFPERLKRGARNLEKYLGVQVKIAKNAFKAGYIAGDPEERAEDINAMLYDDEVKGIFTTIGGDHSIQLIPFIDFKEMRKRPKVFVGFSDITVLHLAFLKYSRVSTVYGPSILYNFADSVLEETVEYLKKAVRNESYELKSYPYTDVFYDWSKGIRKLKKEDFKNTKHRVLIEGTAKGRLFGGCIPSILRTAGTDFFPRYRGIAFLEVPEGCKPGVKEEISKVDADLSQLIVAGFFDRVKGLIFGIPYRYNKKEKEELYKIVIGRLQEYGYDFPIIAEVNMGHTRPILSIRYWKYTKIIAENRVSIQIK